MLSPRFERYVTLYAFPIMMVFMWMIIIASATLRIVNDKQMALEEVSDSLLSFAHNKSYALNSITDTE